MYARAQRASSVRESAGVGEHRLPRGFEKMPASPEARVACEREAELERLHQSVEAAAELVFQQRLAIHRMKRSAFVSEIKRRPFYNSGSGGDAYSDALKQLVDLEDNLSQESSRCIRVSNVTALHLLNEKQYSRTLQILLRVEALAQKGAGMWFPLFFSTECGMVGAGEFVHFAGDRRSGDEEGVREIFVPFFTTRHEKMRQLVLAVIDNNIGLYHFKIAEYELAVRRMSRALHLEELLGVETIGVTYFNLAQAQYECGSLEDAFSAITLAEEAIEKRVHEYQSQNNHLRCTVDCSGSGVNNIPGLERRRLDVYIGWREGVCLLSRVLEAHGRWLQSSNAYKPAINCYEQSDRWLSSVKRLSAEENNWRQELRQRIQECRRFQRHSCCFPKSTVLFSSPAPGVPSGSPRSIVVTTTLPRKIEITACATPFDNGQKGTEKEGSKGIDQRQTRQRKTKHKEHSGKSHYRDVYELSATTTSTSNAAVTTGHHRSRTAPRRPEWDAGTQVVNPDTTRVRPATTATTSSVAHANSEARNSSRLTSVAGTPLSRGSKHERGSSGKPDLSSETGLTSSDVRRTQASAPVAQCTTPFRAQASSNAMANRAWNINISDKSLPLTRFTSSSTKLCPLSLMRCIHILQAFARSRVSLFEKEWRKLPCEAGFVSPQSHSHSSFSVSLPSSWSGRHLYETDGASRLMCGDDSFLKNGGLFVGTPSAHATISLNSCEILLAFLAARRSASLVCQRSIEQRYTKVMEGILRQHASCAGSPSTTVKMRVLRDSARSRSLEETEPRRTISGGAAFSPHRTESFPNRNGELCHRISEGVSSGEGKKNGFYISEGRLHRRYNSLLRMVPQGRETPDTCLDAVKANNRFNGDLASDTAGAMGSQLYSSMPVTPPLSEDSGSRNSRADEIPTSTWRARRWSDFPYTRQSEKNPQKVKNHPQIVPQQRNGTMGAVNCEDFDAPNGKVYGNGVQNGLPPRHPIIRRTPLLTCENHDDIAHTTAVIIRQRLLREEAAIIIQGAWHKWRERRQLGAVRRVGYR
ncbi:hypothetical protein C3747_12g300 [Trypanosoma cruzi]|uniref:Uncharacterized protein n=2 Tax=Trypanosoma cruzi TaxID=5693 RepID=Q4DNN2_TRYCC|nr:hypothetical protein, conserved [Trypanosoma cruzi]EAN94135.1 hypothetical protein, conserved [Trypanosoma cruzi]PWV18864.1 hypothetical protein C3747_12g300 [Trypanosoma cruzi]|eukprot:XP_815986.1 hypothetical protein [Trypanosoma cruzi strain CL Brener]